MDVVFAKLFLVARTSSAGASTLKTPPHLQTLPQPRPQPRPHDGAASSKAAGGRRIQFMWHHAWRLLRLRAGRWPLRSAAGSLHAVLQYLISCDGPAIDLFFGSSCESCALMPLRFKSLTAARGSVTRDESGPAPVPCREQTPTSGSDQRGALEPSPDA